MKRFGILVLFLTACGMPPDLDSKDPKGGLKNGQESLAGPDPQKFAVSSDETPGLIDGGASQMEPVLALAPQILLMNEDGTGKPAPMIAADPERWVMQGASALYRNLIRPKPGERHFLVWNAGNLGPTIQNSAYSVRRQDIDNRIEQFGERRIPAYDAEAGRWYIELGDVVGGDLSESSAADTWLIDLELYLADGSRFLLTYGLRILGPIPALKASFVESSVSSARGQSFVVATDHLQNPFRTRPIRVWVSGGGRLVQSTGLRSTLVQATWNREPEAVHESYSSAAAFRVSHVRVKGRDFPLLGVMSPVLDLAPGEKAEISWVATRENDQQCELPTPKKKRAEWGEYKRRTRRAGKTVEEVVAGWKYPVTWEINGRSLEGEYSRHVLYGDKILTRPERGGIESNDLVARLASGNYVYSRHSGTKPSPAGVDGYRAYSCQGVF